MLYLSWKSKLLVSMWNATGKIVTHYWITVKSWQHFSWNMKSYRNEAYIWDGSQRKSISKESFIINYSYWARLFHHWILPLNSSVNLRSLLRFAFIVVVSITSWLFHFRSDLKCFLLALFTIALPQQPQNFLKKLVSIFSNHRQLELVSFLEG